MQQMHWVRSLGQEDPLEKEMATHSSTFAWKIPRTEEPGRLQFMGLRKSQTHLQTKQQQHGVLYTAKRFLNTKTNKDFSGHVQAERIYTISSSGRRKMMAGESIDTYKGKKSTRYPRVNRSFSYF